MCTHTHTFAFDLCYLRPVSSRRRTRPPLSCLVYSSSRSRQHQITLQLCFKSSSSAAVLRSAAAALVRKCGHRHWSMHALTTTAESPEAVINFLSFSFSILLILQLLFQLHLLVFSCLFTIIIVSNFSGASTRRLFNQSTLTLSLASAEMFALLLQLPQPLNILNAHLSS